MRLIPRSRWRKALYLSITFLLVVAGIIAYINASQSPINKENYRHLQLQFDLSRVQVERLLGAPVDPIRVHRVPPLQPALAGDAEEAWPWYWNLDIPGYSSWVVGCPAPPSVPKVGELMPNFDEQTCPVLERPTIVEVCTWDGPDAQIVVAFDEKGRMRGTRFQERLSWRGKVREWLSWLP